MIASLRRPGCDHCWRIAWIQNFRARLPSSGSASAWNAKERSRQKRRRISRV